MRVAAPIRHKAAIRHKTKPLTSNVAAWRTLRTSQKGTPHMRIRLQGTEDECRRAADAIAAALDVHETSRPYPNRPPSRLIRLYLTAASPSTQRQEDQ